MNAPNLLKVTALTNFEVPKFGSFKTGVSYFLIEPLALELAERKQVTIDKIQEKKKDEKIGDYTPKPKEEKPKTK